MAKKLASKTTKRLLTDVEIKEKNLSKGEFTPTWQGRVYVLNVEKSLIAKKASIGENGEYAIKVR
jgi:RNA polymerase subunit RPABC4/transcription elongation factor Spt4